MKVKLLKKMRKIFLLIEKNGKFQVFENRECLGGIFNKTPFLKKSEAVEIRRNWILEEIRKYG